MFVRSYKSLLYSIIVLYAVCHVHATSCGEGKFQCGYGHCISIGHRCDGTVNCGVNTDELNCENHTCNELQFQCRDGSCLHIGNRCDGGNYNCEDESDEEGCEGYECNNQQFTCYNGGCVNKGAQCEGRNHCTDSSDEYNCGDHNCNDNQLRCDNGECKYEVVRCNGLYSCEDQSDENACVLPTTRFKPNSTPFRDHSGNFQSTLADNVNHNYFIAIGEIFGLANQVINVSILKTTADPSINTVSSSEISTFSDYSVDRLVQKPTGEHLSGKFDFTSIGLLQPTLHLTTAKNPGYDKFISKMTSDYLDGSTGRTTELTTYYSPNEESLTSSATSKTSYSMPRTEIFTYESSTEQTASLGQTSVDNNMLTVRDFTTIGESSQRVLKVELVNVSNVSVDPGHHSGITFSTSTNGNFHKEGPFKILTSVLHLNLNTTLRTNKGKVLSAGSDIANITIYDKNWNEISVDCDINFPIIKNVTTRNINRKNIFPECHFDDVTSGTWSPLGCVTIYEDDYVKGGVTCRCNHLTSFVILMSTQPVTDNTILSTITNVGVAFSCMFLVVTLGVICITQDLRNSDRYKILRHLVIALLCVNFFFLLLELKVAANSTTCVILAGCLHYSLLVAFFWMLITSTDLYLKIQHPFINHQKRYTYCRVIGWLGPVLIVGVTFCITQTNYASEECWLDISSGAIWAFVYPVCITVSIVFLQLIVIGYVVFKKSKLPNEISEEAESFMRIRSLLGGLILLSPAVGLSWIFGIIVVFDDSVTMQYLFVILNSLQGFFIWLSQCVFSKEVRKAVRKRFNKRVGQDSSVTARKTILTLENI